MHILLSMPDGDPDAFFDPRFEAAIKRRLNRDPSEARQFRDIAREVSLLTGD
ncbi:MAG TPA: hypothetical protein VL284_11270 [Thermoanaerobaculia bacterium]|nr:hypothetical protein [Thermoanaerobaculia bacterium]